MRRICTIVDAFGRQYTILSKQCEDISSWVKETEGIPIYEGIRDFSLKPEYRKIGGCGFFFCPIDLFFVQNQV